MTLTLRIDNYDTLDDGGPIWINLDQRGASVGRRASMDWVLPDPAKHVSGHHFDIQFSDGHYWLRDVSTNGTYMQGSQHRLEGPQRLNGGERISVGHYIISVTMGNGAQAGAFQPAPNGGQNAGGQNTGGWNAAADDSDPWDLSPEPLKPVNPLPSAAANPHHLDDMAQDLVPLQRPTDPSPMQSAAAPVQQPGFATGPGENVQRPPMNATTSAPIAMPQHAAPAPMPPPQAPAAPVPPPAMTPTPASVPLAQPRPAPAQPPAAAGAPMGQDNGRAVIEAFCRGAGLPPQAAEGVDPLVLVEMLGKTARVSVDEVMRMLQDRATVKKETRGGERTMTSAIGNNPMKFLPDAEQAFAAMFLQPREGFMTGPDGFENALSDLRRHQMAIFAALQPALADVLSGLSPDAIEGEASSGNLLSGSKKGRNWDSFVERWDEKASAGEHGMLDAFFRAFSKAYTDVSRKSD